MFSGFDWTVKVDKHGTVKVLEGVKRVDTFMGVDELFAYLPTFKVEADKPVVRKAKVSKPKVKKEKVTVNKAKRGRKPKPPTLPPDPASGIMVKEPFHNVNPVVKKRGRKKTVRESLDGSTQYFHDADGNPCDEEHAVNK